MIFSIAHILASFINIWEAFSLHKPLTYMSFMKKPYLLWLLMSWSCHSLPHNYAPQSSFFICLLKLFLSQFWKPETLLKKNTDFNKCYNTLLQYYVTWLSENSWLWHFEILITDHLVSISDILANSKMIVLSSQMVSGRQMKRESGEERKDHSKLTWICACMFTYILQTVLQWMSAEILYICALTFIA